MSSTKTLDFDVQDFARALGRLPEFTPLASEYAAFRGTDYSTWIYRSEQEHMMSWFSAQNTKGGGAYTRGVPNRSAKRTYNRLMNATSVLWIAEAVGADQASVQAALDEMKQESDYRRCPAIVRRHIPWEVIARLIEPHVTASKRPNVMFFKPC